MFFVCIIRFQLGNSYTLVLPCVMMNADNPMICFLYMKLFQITISPTFIVQEFNTTDVNILGLHKVGLLYKLIISGFLPFAHKMYRFIQYL